MSKVEILKLLVPVIILQYGFAIYAIVLVNRQGVRNLNKVAWTLICLCIGIVGPTCYLLYGKKRWEDD